MYTGPYEVSVLFEGSLELHCQTARVDRLSDKNASELGCGAWSYAVPVLGGSEEQHSETARPSEINPLFFPETV